MTTGFEWLDKAMEQTPDPEQSQEELQRVAQEQFELAQLVKRVMHDNEDGARLMNYLFDATIDTPLMTVGKNVPITGEVAMSPADWAYAREGQNSVIRWMREQIKLANNPPQMQEQN